MARYKNGVNGNFSGKVGSVVGSSWRGIAYMRGLPKISRKPPTEKKKATRRSFSFIHTWLNPLQGLVSIGFADFAPGCTGRNSAHSYNSTKALIKTDTGFDIDYTLARFSYGSLPGTSEASIEMKDAATLLIKWDPEGERGAADSDGLMYFIYFPDKNDAVIDIGMHNRKDGLAEIPLLPEYQKQRLEVQIAFKSLIHDNVSTSQYAGGYRPDLAGNPDTDKTRTKEKFCDPLIVGNTLISTFNLAR